MKILRIYRGIPASGKSTLAREVVRKAPKSWVRINRDDFRNMMNEYVFSDKNERLITEVTHKMAREALKKGLNVITDDTNLKQKTVNEWHKIAAEVGDVKVIETFVDISLAEALRRNRNADRDHDVPDHIIEMFYNKYIRSLKVKSETYYPPVERDILYIKQDESLPKCILVDIDGTAAKMTGRSPFDWTAVYEDDVNEPVRQLLDIVEWRNSAIKEHWGDDVDDTKIIFLSGRDGSARDETTRWFKDKFGYEVTYGENLFMRAAGDMRRDSVIKDELYEAHIKGKYNVLFILDDRDQMIEHWRKVVGIPCFQVEYGDF